MEENWWKLSHLFVGVFMSNFTVYMVNPAMTDVIVEAVCKGKEECSLAIYLTGIQQAVAGLGAVVVMPVLGNLSDLYGRKTLILLPLTLSIFPSAILAWNRSTNFFYAYYAIKIPTAMITDGGAVCLALAYLADNVCEERRVSAFGVLFGVMSAANVSGTLAARLLSTPRIFQVAAVVSAVSVVYVTLFLKEKTSSQRVSCAAEDQLQHPILPEENRPVGALESSEKKITFVMKIPSPKKVFNLLTSSVTFSLLVSVAFFNSLAEAGIQSFLLYFYKARFHFNKDQFADVLLITYVGATASSMLLLPLLSLFIGEETLLIVGMFAGFLNMFINSIAWSSWVPYASSSLSLIFQLANPNLKSLVSKQTGPNEQGMAQGSILGIVSFGNLVSPIIYSPLSALFLSEGAPFHFPGFSIFCVGLAYLVGCILSIFIKRHVKSRNRSIEGE